ncbi:hypothetical protein J6590_048241 [Homalodisca vitripennis]|nr:hypothetical protein J6590_048241 [Homalodisca vitripennis]
MVVDIIVSLYNDNSLPACILEKTSKDQDMLLVIIQKLQVISVELIPVVLEYIAHFPHNDYGEKKIPLSREECGKGQRYPPPPRDGWIDHGRSGACWWKQTILFVLQVVVCSASAGSMTTDGSIPVVPCSGPWAAPSKYLVFRGGNATCLLQITEIPTFHSEYGHLGCKSKYWM